MSWVSPFSAFEPVDGFHKTVGCYATGSQPNFVLFELLVLVVVMLRQTPELLGWQRHERYVIYSLEVAHRFSKNMELLSLELTQQEQNKYRSGADGQGVAEGSEVPSNVIKFLVVLHDGGRNQKAERHSNLNSTNMYIGFSVNLSEQAPNPNSTIVFIVTTKL